MNDSIEIIDCVGCHLCSKCIKLCEYWCINVKIRETHLVEKENETYPIIYIKNKKTSYEEFCKMIASGRIGE